jgi:SAM-dependent methyltransferase
MDEGFSPPAWFYAGIIGLAILRLRLTNPAAARKWVTELQALLDGAFPALDQPRRVRELSVTSGYAEWSRNYDAPTNPLVAVEQPVVWSMLDEIAPGIAIDAACGTGRQSEHLAARGFEVHGFDTTPEMLAIARERVGDGEFHIGDVHAIAFDDGFADLTCCTLALTHTDDLAGAVGELARVTRSGGHVVLSDLHPIAVATGGAALFDGPPGELPFVTTHPHQVSDYLGAFRAAGLDVEECREPPVGTALDHIFPGELASLTQDAFADLPFALIWHLRRG